MHRRTVTTALVTAALLTPLTAAAPAAEAATRPAPGTSFTAYGPSWRAVVDRGRLSVDGRNVSASKVKVTRSAFARGVEFTGRHRGKTLTLVVRRGRCVDTAGHDTGQRATLYVGKRAYRGCAVNGALPIADT